MSIVGADQAPRVVIEYAIPLAGGSMQLLPDDPEVERIYPLADRIRHQQRHGGRVFRRRIVVVDDWVDASTVVDLIPVRVDPSLPPGTVALVGEREVITLVDSSVQAEGGGDDATDQ